MDLKGILNIYFLNYKFNNKQLTELKLGRSHKVDYFIYAKLEYTWRQMREIRLGLEGNLDVDYYLNPSLNFKEMEERRTNLSMDKFFANKL